MNEPTDAMIDRLAGGLTPVRRLPSPGLRALGLIGLATLLIVVVVALRGLRTDIAAQLQDPSFLVAVAAAWATGAAATLAALEISLPDRSQLWAWLPLPAGILWVWGVGWGCLAHWVTIIEAKPVEESGVQCLITLVAASIPLTLILWRSLGRARPLRRSSTAWLAAVAVAAYADVAHLLCHVVEATVFVLLLNLGVAALSTVALAGLGRRVMPRFG